ncbi:10354_t:CDS:2, partial [Gigaspora rosea]
AASPDKCQEIVSKQKDDGSIELDDSVCNELDTPKEEIITTIKKKITNEKLKSPEHSTSLATAINLAYLKNAASKYEDDWQDKYKKARDYLSKQIGDKNAEDELIKCADEYVVDKVTDKVIEEKKQTVIDLKEDEIPKVEKPKSFFGGIYEKAAKLGDQIEKAITFDQKKHGNHEKAEALIVVEESATPEKCKEIVSHQNEDGSIELVDTVCHDLDVPKEEIITTIQEKTTNDKLKTVPPQVWETAINLSYLKKAAPKHEGLWRDKYNKAREYLSKLIGDENAEKELLDCADNFVVDNSTKKVIKDKKRNAVVTVQNSTTPEKCNEAVSNQKGDGSFEISETVCKEIDVPVEKVVTEVKKDTKNEKLKSPESEPWWKTGLTLSYLNVAAPHHKKQWEDKDKKAREYLSDQIKDTPTEKELLDCTDKYVVDNVTKKVEKDHKKDKAITIVQDAASPKKSQEIVSKQKDNGCIELDDSVCDELGAPKEDIITTIKKKITNTKLKSPEFKTSLETAINLSYLKNAASKYEGDWRDKYNKAREYLSDQIGDKKAEEELIECADEYVIDKVTDKVIEKKKQDAIELKKDEIPTVNNFFGDLYKKAVKLGDQIEKAITFDNDKHDDHEKAEALIIVEESATPEKCKEITSKQKKDGSIELGDSICNDLDAPKEEVITTIQKKITNDKLKSPKLISTAVNLSYLKKAAPKHESLWKDKYDKAREYLSKLIGDKNAEKELLDCADNYVVENSTKKVIKDKKRNAVAKLRDSTTPEKCNEAVSNQKDDGSFEISETVCKEIDVPVEKVVTEVKKDTRNEKLKSPKSEPWWKTALTLGYLKAAAPDHKKQWEDKEKKAREYLSDQIKDAAVEKELLDCADKYVVDNVAKKVEKDHKKDKAITIVQDAASPDKCQEIVSKQKEDGSIELDDSVCNELGVPKEDIITTIKKKITNEKLKSPEHSTSLATAINLSYLKNAASKYKGDWEDKYNKAREYLSKQIGDKKAEEELVKCADEKMKYRKKSVKSFFGDLYETASKLGDQIERAITFDNDKHDDHEKAEALIIVEESATPEKCKEITSNQKDNGSIELGDSVCNDLDAPKEEIITTIQEKITNDKLKSPEVISTAVNLSYLKKAAPKHESLWKDKYNEARDYLSNLIGDKNAEKELLDCADNYVVENSTKKVIKDKKRNSVAKVRDSTTPEKCNEAVSDQKDDGSFEITETVCKEIDVPVEKVVTEVKKDTKNEKLKSPESEPWWKTGLTVSYLNVAAPHHKKQWEDKEKKAREYLSDQIKDTPTEKELLDCTDKYVVDNVTKKVEKDHKKDVAITIVQDAASPDKCQEIVSKQKEDGSIELDDSVCNELGVPKEDIITTIKKKITNEKLKSPEHSTSLATAINLSYLKNAASKHKGDWEDKYNKAREYLSKQIGDKKAEEELIECADEYVVDKVTDKVIKEKERDVIDLKKDEIPKKSVKNFFGGLYETAAKLGDQIENAITFDKNKHGNHEKAEALIIVEESATPEKCKEITSNQKDNGSIELNDSVCNDLDAPKEEIITKIQEKITNDKLKSPEVISTAVNLSYLKKAAPKHENLWKDKYDKAREYLSNLIGDKNAEKELLDCADNYVVENSTKKVIKDKKRNSVAKVRDSTTPEKCNEAISNQKDDGSFEISETVCKEIDVPVEKVVTEVKKDTKNEKLKSPESEPWWKTGLTVSYLNVAAPHHKKQWEDKDKKAREYLSDQIKDTPTEKELLDCTDKYVVDNVTKKVEKDHKKEKAITIVQDAASPDKCQEIVSKQKEDGSIELDDSVCFELRAPKEDIITTIKKKITNEKLKSPEHSTSLATAVNLAYLKNAASKYEGDWRNKYNKAREYLSNQIGDKKAEEELLECADEYVIDKVTDKVIKEKERDVIELKKDEIPKDEKGRGIFGGLYDTGAYVVETIKSAFTFNKNKIDDHEKAEALIIAEESATPEKCEEIVSNQKDDGSIELNDTVCNELDVPKEELIPTIQKKITNDKIKSPELISTAVNLSYLKKAAPKHESLWKDKYDKARDYLSKQIGDANAEKELLDCADDYVIENCTKKVITDKKKNAVVTVQDSTTPEKCNDAVSHQKDDGSFEISDTVCKEIDVPVADVVPTAKKYTQNKKLKSPGSEPWWKTALTLSYLKVAAPQHKKLWEDKEKKAREYLSEQIGDAAAEKELLDCADKYVVDNVTKKVEKDHKKDKAITIVQDAASPDKCQEIVSKQKDDGSIELDDSVCKELDVPKEDIITTIKKKITNTKLKSPEFKPSIETAINLAYLKNAASQHEGEWRDKYNKAREYLSKQIGNKDAEEELIKCADDYVVDKVTDKVIEEKKRDVIELKKDEIPKAEKGKSFFGGLYETAASKIGDIGNQIGDALTFDKDKHDDHEKAEALIIVEESATPEKCKEIVSGQKENGSIELGDTVCNELDAPKEEIITTIHKNIKNNKLKSPELISTAVNLSYLKKAAPKHDGLWRDKYNKAREYLSKQIGDTNAEKELLDCADNYVIDHSIKKVIKDKKKNAVVELQGSTTPEKCNDVVSNQKDDGSFEVSETICKEIDIPVDVVPVVKKETQNEKLKSPKSEP